MKSVYIQMKQIFDGIPNDKTLPLESHLSGILFWRSNCYSVTDASNILLNTHTKFPLNQNVMMDALEPAGNTGRFIKNDTFLYILSCIFNFRHWKLYFSRITQHVRVTLRRPQYLFVTGAKPFPAKKCQIRLFQLSFSDIPYCFTGSVPIF